MSGLWRGMFFGSLLVSPFWAAVAYVLRTI